jgi:hypothetical protein
MNYKVNLLLILLVAGTASAQKANMSNQEMLDKIHANGDTLQSLNRLKSIPGPSDQPPPLLTIIEDDYYVRYTVILWEDGQIMWRDDYDQMEYTKDDERPFVTLSDNHYIYGPYNRTRLPSEKVSGYISTLNQMGICEDIGEVFLTRIGAPKTMIKLNIPDCPLSLAYHFDYLAEDELETDRGIVSLGEVSREDALTSQTLEIQRAYEVHGAIKDGVFQLIKEAEKQSIADRDLYVEFVKYAIPIRP